VRALDHVSLSIERGRFVGADGARRAPASRRSCTCSPASTARPKAASRWRAALLNELSDDELASFRAQHVGFIFQFFNLIPVLSARENVELPLLLTKLSKSDRRERASTALRVVGLAERAEHMPGEMSGGEQQRVAIARAIVSTPRSWWPTSRPAISTRRTRSRSSRCCATCAASSTRRW
jgi:putative ABC transport system ATP-binding protein